ncbi:garvicin Q family class II bacteriocin [Periweissella fabalis]
MLASRQYRYYCANGYEYRDSKGRWHYVVTKSPFQAAYGVSLHGWEGAPGGSWK